MYIPFGNAHYSYNLHRNAEAAEGFFYSLTEINLLVSISQFAAA